MQKDRKGIIITIAIFFTTVSFLSGNNVKAQEASIDEKERYPLAFNVTGQIKHYEDCGYKDISSDSQGVDKTIIEFTINEGLVKPPSFNLGSDEFYPQQDEEKADITPQQIDCLIDIREVEKTKEYKDCGYTGEDSPQAVDKRLSMLSMEVIPKTTNQTMKTELQKEADCLVDIRSLEKQTADLDYAINGGKFLAYKIVDGEVNMKNYTECIGHKTLGLSPETVDMRIRAMTIDILNADLGKIIMSPDKKQKWEAERNCLIAIRNTELGIW